MGKDDKVSAGWAAKKLAEKDDQIAALTTKVAELLDYRRTFATILGQKDRHIAALARAKGSVEQDLRKYNDTLAAAERYSELMRSACAVEKQLQAELTYVRKALDNERSTSRELARVNQALRGSARDPNDGLYIANLQQELKRVNAELFDARDKLNQMSNVSTLKGALADKYSDELDAAIRECNEALTELRDERDRRYHRPSLREQEQEQNIEQLKAARDYHMKNVAEIANMHARPIHIKAEHFHNPKDASEITALKAELSAIKARLRVLGEE